MTEQVNVQDAKTRLSELLVRAEAGEEIVIARGGKPVGDPARIPAAALEATQNPRNELFVSAISPFEIATKHRIGKFPDAQRVLVAYGDYLRQLRAEQLPITSHHGIVAGQLSWDHRDPFDRTLAAQSITESMPLVTADKIFTTMGGGRTLWE